MENKKEVMARDTYRAYRDLLRDSKWLEFAEEVISRKGAACEVCTSEDRLEVHHLGYRIGRLPWEYSDAEVEVLCHECHGNIHKFADDLWNEALKAKNQWIIYECAKAIKRVIERDGLPEFEAFVEEFLEECASRMVNK